MPTRPSNPTSLPPAVSPGALAVLRWLGEVGLATGDQLARRFWPEAAPVSAGRALHRLRAGGYLLTRPWQAPHTPLYARAPAGGLLLRATPPAIQIGWPSRS